MIAMPFNIMKDTSFLPLRADERDALYQAANHDSMPEAVKKQAAVLLRCHAMPGGNPEARYREIAAALGTSPIAVKEIHASFLIQGLATIVDTPPPTFLQEERAGRKGESG